MKACIRLWENTFFFSTLHVCLEPPFIIVSPIAIVFRRRRADDPDASTFFSTPHYPVFEKPARAFLHSTLDAFRLDYHFRFSCGASPYRSSYYSEIWQWHRFKGAVAELGQG